MKLDPKAQLDGVLYSRPRSVRMWRDAHAAAIQKLASVKLELRAGAAPQSAAAMQLHPGIRSGA